MRRGAMRIIVLLSARRQAVRQEIASSDEITFYIKERPAGVSGVTGRQATVFNSSWLQASKCFWCFGHFYHRTAGREIATTETITSCMKERQDRPAPVFLRRHP